MIRLVLVLTVTICMVACSKSQPAKDKSTDAAKQYPEALKLVSVEDETVKTLDKPTVSQLPNSDQTTKRIEEFDEKLGAIDQETQDALLKKVVELWGLDPDVLKLDKRTKMPEDFSIAAQAVLIVASKQ